MTATTARAPRVPAHEDAGQACDDSLVADLVMDMSQVPPGKVLDLAGPGERVSVRLAGRRPWLSRFLAICLLAAVVGGPASLAGGVSQETSPFAKMQNASLIACVSIVDTTMPTPPTITITQPPDVTAGAPVALAASVSPPGLPLLFSSDTSSVCTVADSAVTTLAVGPCTIAAYQHGECPRAAVPVTRSFQVQAGPTGLPRRRSRLASRLT